MKIRLVGANKFHVDGRTDTTKQMDVILNVSKAPSKLSSFVANLLH